MVAALTPLKQALCKDESLSGGAIPEDNGRLYYGMIAPFVNYSVAGWLWYQGENNCYGDMGNSVDGTGYGCSLPAMINSWRYIWSGAHAEKEGRLFGIATLASGGSEGASQHMAGMRWSQTANYGQWDNPALPNTFGAQVYDLGDPWAQAGDGNQLVLNATTGKPVEPKQLRCCIPPNKKFNITGDPGCGNKTATDPALRSACTDKFECTLPDPQTGQYGKWCEQFNSARWSPALKPLAALVKLNAPSGEPGVNFMGGIHPRLKRPVGHRLAYAAARMLKQQQRRQQSKGEAGDGDGGSNDGALTGPTISGCSYTASTGELEIKFNQTLLGGEGLMLRPFDANETGGWGDQPGTKGYQPLDAPAVDANGAMVCTVDPTCQQGPGANGAPCGNATSCMCQSWQYMKYGDPTKPGSLKAFWYCEGERGSFSPCALVLVYFSSTYAVRCL